MLISVTAMSALRRVAKNNVEPLAKKLFVLFGVPKKTEPTIRAIIICPIITVKVDTLSFHSR